MSAHFLCQAAATSRLSASERVFSVTELLDSVIDLLSDNFPVLKASSSVCKSWSYSTARHLFKCLRLSARALSTTDTESPGVSRWRTLKSCPRILHNVRELDMLAVIPSSPLILGLFTHLDSLTYCDWHGPKNMQGSSATRRAAHGNRRPTVHELTLHRLTDDQDMHRLGQTIDVSKLRKLSLLVHVLQAYPAPSINAFLAQHSPPLQDIHIELLTSMGRRSASPDNAKTRHGWTFSFASTPLHTICISLILLSIPFSLPMNTTVWESLIDSMLIAPASLSRATIILRCRRDSHHPNGEDIHVAVNALNWARLEQMLETRPPFSMFDIHIDLSALNLSSSSSVHEKIITAIPAHISQFVRFTF